MSNKNTLGYIYVSLEGSVYKMVDIKVGGDGSIYLFTPLGSYPTSSSGVMSTKFSYHPDGKTHTTSGFDFSAIGEGNEAFKKIAPGALRRMGMGYKNGKIYSQDFGVNIPLNTLKEAVYTSFGISYFNIGAINTKSEMLAQAKDGKKMQLAKVIDGSKYKDITIRFYLVPDQLLEGKLQVAQKASLEFYIFKHPNYDFHVVALIEDEWLGGGEDAKPEVSR